MYSFANRDDCKVIDEPFYGHYLLESNASHPGDKEIIDSMENNWSKIVDQVNQCAEINKIVFVKNMAHHITTDNLSFMREWTNLYLVRDPKQIISSFAQVISNPSISDIGIKRQLELFRQVPGAVVDSNQLLRDPVIGLETLCKHLGIYFSDKMTSWKAGPVEEDGIWAKHWYANVHNSTGFRTQKTSNRSLPKHLQSLYEEAKPYFEELKKHSILN